MPNWVTNAVIYQIFPDRFRNGSTKNDPKTGDVRYDDRSGSAGSLPEGTAATTPGATCRLRP